MMVIAHRFVSGSSSQWALLPELLLASGSAA
jgi:hypothetical protein